LPGAYFIAPKKLVKVKTSKELYGNQANEAHLKQMTNWLDKAGQPGLPGQPGSCEQSINMTAAD
jgi:hypothetical protein